MTKRTKPSTRRKPAKKQDHPPLARAGDPLVLANGTLVQEDPLPGSLEDEIKRKRVVSPRTFRASRRRSLKDLPADVNILNGIACVILYTLMGVGDREIADGLKIKPEDLRAIRGHPAHEECFNSVVSELINANSDLIAARLAAYAGNAVDNIMNLAEGAKKEDVKLRANVDIADRGGINPKDMAMKNAMNGNDLKIQIIKGSGDDFTVNIGDFGSGVNHTGE